MVQWFGWRAAFALPGLLAMACGWLFARLCPQESEAPSRRTTKATVSLPPALLARVLVVMTAASVTIGLLFNFSTNGNAQLLAERFRGVVENPALLGTMLAGVYAVASLAQVVVGRLIDRYPLRRLYLSIVVLQPPLLALAAVADGWLLLVLQTGFMIVIFGAIPFTDAMIVRYVDDRMRSRVTGIRLAISFGVSSAAVWMLGPVVKSAGFAALLYAMAVIALCTLLFAAMLPEPASEPSRAPA
jgi:predicted MFS family arabinose efflux permease